MSPFELSSEHETFRKSVREFALGEIAPHAARWDKEHHFPTDVVRQMGDIGLTGLTAPEEFGGMGEDGDFTWEAKDKADALREAAGAEVAA